MFSQIEDTCTCCKKKTYLNASERSLLLTSSLFSATVKNLLSYNVIQTVQIDEINSKQRNWVTRKLGLFEISI